MNGLPLSATTEYFKGQTLPTSIFQVIRATVFVALLRCYLPGWQILEGNWTSPKPQPVR